MSHLAGTDDLLLRHGLGMDVLEEEEEAAAAVVAIVPTSDNFLCREAHLFSPPSPTSIRLGKASPHSRYSSILAAVWKNVLAVRHV